MSKLESHEVLRARATVYVSLERCLGTIGRSFDKILDPEAKFECVTAQANICSAMHRLGANIPSGYLEAAKARAFLEDIRMLRTYIKAARDNHEDGQPSFFSIFPLDFIDNISDAADIADELIHKPSEMEKK